MTIERNAYDCNKKSIFRFLAVLKYDKNCNKKSIFRFLAVLKYDKDSNMIVIKNQVLGSLPPPKYDEDSNRENVLLEKKRIHGTHALKRNSWSFLF